MSIEAAKNMRKYDSYKYGFERINLAIEEEFFLEAITYAESIISDRLISYLVYKNILDIPNEKSLNKTSLSSLIREWRNLDREVIWKERENLIEDVDKWRLQRNECAHGLAKSQPGHPTKPVEDFIMLARECAIEGKLLACHVCAWTQKHKRQLSKVEY